MPLKIYNSVHQFTPFLPGQLPLEPLLAKAHELARDALALSCPPPMCRAGAIWMGAAI